MNEETCTKISHTAKNNASGRQALAMGLCYGLGVFNDNFFKQAALLLAATAGMTAFQGWATFLFAAPFVLFSSAAGWFADRCNKKSVIVWAKLLEVLAMAVGAWGMITLQWPWLLGMVFCMGLNSTLFCPALNGSIPEFFPPSDVPRVNALLKLATTGAVLAGTALSGVALDGFGLVGSDQGGFGLVGSDQGVFGLVGSDQGVFGSILGQIGSLTNGMPPAVFGQTLVAGIVLLVAVAGLAVAFFLKGRPTAGGTAPFPWSGPLDAFRDLAALRRRDPALLLSMSGDAFFCFISTLVVLLITNLGRQELDLSYTLTSMLFVSLLIGICVGSLIAARGTPWSWRRWMVPSLSLIGVLLMVVPLTATLPEALQVPVLFGLYFVTGICGGVFLIPLTSFAQVRPAPTERGRMLGASYCLSFTAILVAGQCFALVALVPPSMGHVIAGAGTLVAAWLFARTIRRLPLSEADVCAAAAKPCRQGARWGGRCGLAFVRGILGLRYRLRVEGLAAIRQSFTPARGTLFLPNHPALVDPLLVYSTLAPDFLPRPLADKGQLDRPVVRTVAGLAHPVLIPDLKTGCRATRAEARAGVLAGLNAVIDALRAGENVMLYPSGGLSRDGYEHLGNNGGVRHILRAVPEARVVLVRTRGLWGSSFGWAGGCAPSLLDGMRRGALRLLCHGLFFMPRRDVCLTLHEDATVTTLAAENDARALNRHLEAFYNDGLPELPKIATIPNEQEPSETGGEHGAL